MTGNRDKLRSVLLTALMVFSVFAGTVALSGAAAAQAVPDVEQDPVEFSSDVTGENHVEVTFESAPPGGATYQVEDRQGNNVTTSVRATTGNTVLLDIGQDLSGEATLIVNGEEFDITTTSTTVEDFAGAGDVSVFKGSTVAIVNTTATEQGFGVKEGGEFPFLQRNTGTDSVVAALDTGDVNELTTGETFYVEFDSGRNVSMGVRSLGLSVEADDTSVSYTEENATIEATASSNIAPRPDIEFRLKEGGDYVDDDDITDGANNRTADIDGDGEVTETFDVEEGNYTIEVVDIQTGISDETETIQVTEVSGDASFARAVTSEERGDVVEFTVEMSNRDEATINIGDEDVSYFAQLEIEDGDDDGEVIVQMNTFAPSVASSFEVDDDDDEITYVGATTPGGAGPFNVGVPLAAASYDMNITDMSNNEEFDVGTISLRERSTTALRTWTAPANAYSSLDEPDKIIDYAQAGNLTRDSTIANGDVVVQEVQVSGIYGALEAQSGSEFDQFVALNPGGTGDINMTFTESDATVAPNAQGATFTVNSLGSDDVQVVPDADNNTLYLVIDSKEFLNDANFEEDDRLEANFTVEDSGDLTNNDETVTSEFAIIEAEADFDTNAELADGTDIVRVRAAEGQNVTGTTSLAPGTEIDVAARATGDSPFLLSAEGEVQPNGRFVTTFDFSNVSAGQNFTLEIRNPSAVNDVEVDAQVAAAATASVRFNDQTSSGDQVRVASTSLSEGGFVTIHDSTLQDGDAIGSVLGTSSYLEPGSSSGITVTLDDPISETQTLIAMPHMDTNGNEAYDFVSSEGAQDGPYTSGGAAVTDSAEVTVSMPTETPTPTATPEPTPTATPEPTPTATAEPTDEPTDEPTPEPTTTGDGAGFGLVVALIALIGAALLAVRRND